MSLATTQALKALDDRVKLAAAISANFDPLRLFHADSLLDDNRVEMIDVLAAVCDEVEVTEGNYRHWSMQPEARQHVLQTMATRTDFKSLLEVIDVPPDDMFAKYLRDGLRGVDLSALVPPDEAAPSVPRNTVDLDCLLRAVRFLEGVPDIQTKTNELERKVRRQIAINEAEKALQAVIPTRLIGREREYASLLNYRATVLATDGDWVPSFVLEGPGGVGKSALLSKFVSDQRQASDAAPLIYLDFDRATLISAGPLDLTFEFTRQLGLADVTLDPIMAEFRQRSRSLLGGQEKTNIDISGGASSAALRDLASILSEWPLRMGPVTIVLDTFEEVAIRGVTPVRDVLQWVADLRNKVQLEQVHLIVCGRAVVPDAPHLPPKVVASMFNVRHELPLDDLATDEAIVLLTELGVGPDLAPLFPPVFGGNPLVLKLIHRFVSTNDLGDVKQLLREGEEARRHAPSGEVGLRFVYERILNRIKNPRVQALAYPGVVLRRVTPELILHVLAPTCPGRLDVTTLADAEAAFAELAEHVWLVNRVAADLVVHRADLRRLLVPGLEQNPDINAEAIHRAAATYYAGRPASVDPDAAEIEQIYHRGFFEDISDILPRTRAARSKADWVVRNLAGDIEFWPVGARAAVKSLAGRHTQLTETEVASLAAEEQRRSRGIRIEESLASWDVDSAAYEESQLELLDDTAREAIPDSRWALLFDRGDFEFMSESSSVLRTVERYFADGRFRALPSSPTHEHPWYIALAILMTGRGDRPLFSNAALTAIDSDWAEARRYGAALAALAGDLAAHAKIIEGVRAEFPPRLDLFRVDDIVMCQAVAAWGDLDDLATIFQTFSYDHFRLSHVAAIANAAGEFEVADRVSRITDQFEKQPPYTTDINHLRGMLAGKNFTIDGAKKLRAAPTTLSFLYGAIRTIIGQLDRKSYLDLVADLEQRSVFWPVDLRARALDQTLRGMITPSDLTELIEMADNCGLIVDLIDGASSRAHTQLSIRLAAGIRQIEGLLFPFAKVRAELPSLR